MYIYIKSSLCKWDVYLYKKVLCVSGVLVHGGGGGADSIDKKSKGVGLQHTKYVIANGKLRQSSTFW